MRHGITRLLLGCQPFIDLTLEQYTEAKAAKERLIGALRIEEKLNLVLENYAEFEQELQDLTTRHLLFGIHDWSSAVGDAQTINRRLVNLLSAGRLYIDHIKHEVSALYGDDSHQFEQLDQAFSAEYDSCQGYRVLEALRNHVQHRSLPIHSLKYSHVCDEKRNRRLVKVICTPTLSVSRIKDQGNFKASVLEELEGADDLIDLKPLVREYVASIGAVHEGLRARIRDDVADWEKVVRSIQTQFRAAFGDDDIGLAVVVKDDNGIVQESAQIFDDLITRRQQLEKKNRTVSRTRSHYVSTEVLGDNE